jgi:hypothetical protein
VEEVMMGLNANLAKRVFLAAMLSGLSACVGQGVEGSEDDYADGASESETESETELGSASAALNGTQAAVLNGVYTIIDSDTCLGGANNGRACTANANCPGGTCSLGAQRCTQGPADKIGDKCTYHHQCGAGGFCYTQGTKLFSAETGAGFSLRMANFSSVKVVIANPSSGRYKVEHGTGTGTPTWGWVDGPALKLHHQPTTGLSASRTNALMRARSAMGISYWWGHGKWPKAGPTVSCVGANCTSNAGRCLPDAGSTGCPNCTHQATGGTEYGSDCSGLVSTVWGFFDYDPTTDHTGVRDPADPTRWKVSPGYTTSGFMGTSPSWTTVSNCATPPANCTPGTAQCSCFGSTLPADAMVTDGHIFLVGFRNAAGVVTSYECRGCNFGCNPQVRTLADGPSVWRTIRRANGNGVWGP